MNKNALGQPEKADIALLESLRSRLMPLVYNLEELKNKVMFSPKAPPDWPSVQRSIASLSSTLESIQTLINGNPEMTETLRSLHAYPRPPMSLADPNLAGLTDTLLRKVPDPKENDWILSRLTKAAEFAHVPGDWGIEAKKPTEDMDEENEEGTARVRRYKANLDEDQLADIWAACKDIVDGEMHNLENMDGDDGDSPMSSADAETPSQAEGSAPAQETTVVQPMMSLDTIHRFMSTGAVVQ